MEHFGTPHWHPHDMELLQAMKFELAQSYTSLLSRLESHAEDNTRHVTCEEKDTWNNKADKVQMRDLEMRMTEKADYNDLVELKELVTKIKTAVDNGTTTSVGDIVTKTEFDTELERIQSRLTNLNGAIQTTQNSLNAAHFATVDWVNGQQFIKAVDLKDAVITAITSNKDVQDAIAGVVSDNIGDTVADAVESAIASNLDIQNQIKQYITEIVGENPGGNNDITLIWQSMYREGVPGSHYLGTLSVNNSSVELWSGGSFLFDNYSEDNPDGYLTRDQIIALIEERIVDDDTIESKISNIISSTNTTRHKVEGATLILD